MRKTLKICGSVSVRKGDPSAAASVHHQFQLVLGAHLISLLKFELLAHLTLVYECCLPTLYACCLPSYTLLLPSYTLRVLSAAACLESRLRDGRVAASRGQGGRGEGGARRNSAAHRGATAGYLFAFFIQQLLRYRLDRASEEFHTKQQTCLPWGQNGRVCASVHVDLRELA